MLGKKTGIHSILGCIGGSDYHGNSIVLVVIIIIMLAIRQCAA